MEVENSNVGPLLVKLIQKEAALFSPFNILVPPLRLPLMQQQIYKLI